MLPTLLEPAPRSAHTARSTTRPLPLAVGRLRAGIQQMFSGRSSVGTPSSPPDSPKTPRLPLDPNNLSSRTEPAPDYSRYSSQPAANPLPPTTTRPAATHTPQQRPVYSGISILSFQTGRRPPRPFVDPEEQQLAELANEGRRRRHKTPVEKKCFPKIKSKRTRSKMVTCVVSGLVNTYSSAF